MSYFTQAEKARLQAECSNKDDMLGYQNVSQSQLSLARFSGAITINGHTYIYFPQHDELWRDDVLALVHGWRRTDALARELPAMPTQVQGELL